MATTPLERLLFLQGGLCFFCKAPLPKAEASIEHLQAVAHGGTNHDANRVACCKTLNGMFGSMPLKEKIETVLKHKRGFVCPNARKSPPAPRAAGAGPKQAPGTPPAPPTDALPMAAPAAAALEYVIDNLKRRGTARPRNDTKLRSMLAALCEQQKLGCSVDELLHLLVNGGTVLVDGAGKVSYRL